MNKQGRSDDLLSEDTAKEIKSDLEATQTELYSKYTDLLDKDFARELARINLPLSTYTEWYWKIDLHNLFHFLRLRLDHHAQYEIQVYGEVIAEMLKQIVPLSWEAFEDYNLHGRFFSRSELKALNKLVGSELEKEDLKELGLSMREIREFNDKLDHMKKL